MSLLAGQVHSLSATTPLKFTIADLRFTIWQAAPVLPRVSGVLETLPRADAQPTSGPTRQSKIVNRKEMVRLPGIAPGRPPWQEGILAVKSQPHGK